MIDCEYQCVRSWEGLKKRQGKEVDAEEEELSFWEACPFNIPWTSIQQSMHLNNMVDTDNLMMHMLFQLVNI